MSTGTPQSKTLASKEGGPSDWPNDALTGLSAGDPTSAISQDRSLPLWVNLISSGFAAAIAICLVVLAGFTFYLQDLVAVQGIETLAVILAATAVVPVLGIVIFSWGLARALSGYRYLMRRSAGTGVAVIALLSLVGLAALHPLFLVAPGVAILLGWLCCGPLASLFPSEHLWTFRTKEAVSLLSGRDRRGLDLCNQPKADHILVSTLLLALQLLTTIASFSLASWLASRDLLNPSAITAVALLAGAATWAIHGALRHRSRLDPEHVGRAATVTFTELPEDQPANDHGLLVKDLSVQDTSGHPLLQSIEFECPPGQIVGLKGDSFAGKSLLLSALAAPHDLTDLCISGTVLINGTPPWIRSAKAQSLLVHHLPASPLMVEGTGRQNLSCFDEERRPRAERTLKSLVFNTDSLEHILNSNPPGMLSHGQQKALGFARALSLQAAVTLLDRPEDGAPETLINAFIARMREQTRAGCSFILASDDRRFLDACDQLLILQNGRLIEYAPTAEIRARQSTGWQRFVTELSLESEDALDSWLRAQFRRDGDEANRRKVCLVANEMLALAYRQKGLPEDEKKLHFDFKLMAGRCVIRLHLAAGPVSSGMMDQARLAAEEDQQRSSLSPLARIFNEAVEVESTISDGGAVLQVTIAIYDPRLASHNANTGRQNAPDK